jgi:hypothetical protein
MSEVVATQLQKDICKLNKSRGDRPVVFLGGDCTDNSWRDDVIKEYGKNITFLDPYDDNWKAEENVYDEIAGIVQSDWVIFYKGGEQTQRELDFLKTIGRTNDEGIRRVDNLTDLRKILDAIVTLHGKKKLCVASVIRECAYVLDKDAMPTEITIDKGDVDFYFESLDVESRKKVMEDFVAGETIIIPEMEPDLPKRTISRRDFDEVGVENILRQMKGSLRQVTHDSPLAYDSVKHTYRRKEAKKGETYDHSSTQVDLPEQIAQEVLLWGKINIPKADLCTTGDAHGLEDEIHVTLLYGLTVDGPDGVAEFFKKVKPFEVRLGIINCFKDDKHHDVLKIDVESPIMEKLHYVLRENFKNKATRPTYHPHITVGYLKKGKVDKYIGDEKFRGVVFKADKITYSSKDGKKILMPLLG